MKRWTTIAARTGTTLIAVSLALFLVSIVPQSQFSRTEGSTQLPSEQVSVLFTTQQLTPQQEINITVSSEGSIKVYLLDIGIQFQFFDGSGYAFKLSDLQKVLEEQPEKKVWEGETENGQSLQMYSPTKVMNATIVVYNPSSETAQVEYSVSLKNSLAPTNKVQDIAVFAAPTGILLTLPWLLNWWKQKKEKQNNKVIS